MKDMKDTVLNVSGVSKRFGGLQAQAGVLAYVALPHGPGVEAFECA